MVHYREIKKLKVTQTTVLNHSNNSLRKKIILYVSNFVKQIESIQTSSLQDDFKVSLGWD